MYSQSRSLSTALNGAMGWPDSAASLDIIFIEGFAGETVSGIDESELDRPQPLVIDVHAGLPRARACDTDCIGDTIDYSVVHARLSRLLQEHQLKLLEALAETVADILLDEFGAGWVRVKIVKPRKFDDVAAVGVLIERVANPGSTVGRSANVVQLLGSGLVPGDRGLSR
jgi:dihydroneopterin aldolase